MSHPIPTVAVINNNQDTVEMLRACLQGSGFSSVVTGHVPDIRRGTVDFVQFLDVHDPAVLLWDIALPYEENWRFVHMLMGHGRMQGRQVVPTTTNKRVLESPVGATDAIEIVGKPYDLEHIVVAVKMAAGCGWRGSRADRGR